MQLGYFKPELYDDRSDNGFPAVFTAPIGVFEGFPRLSDSMSTFAMRGEVFNQALFRREPMMEDGVDNRKALAKRGGAKAIECRLHEIGTGKAICDCAAASCIDMAGDLAEVLAPAFAG